jgi:transcriptional regulator with XRE-family HTH domain
MKEDKKIGIFGNNLKSIRLFLNISQSELSERSGLTTAAISQIESGKREPSLRSICSILKALNIKFERMMGAVK